MIITFWGFIKNWGFYMREKMGRIQQTRNSMNAIEDSHAHRNMIDIKPQEDNKEFRMKKEEYDRIMDTFKKIESRFKSLESHKEFTIKKESRCEIPNDVRKVITVGTCNIENRSTTKNKYLP